MSAVVAKQITMSKYRHHFQENRVESLFTSQAGFTLIEVLVASTILAFAAASVMMIGRSSIQSYDSSFERTQAYLLVQEGLEIVRSIRDNQSIDHQSNNWSQILPSPAPGGEVWQVVWNSLSGRWELRPGRQDIQLDNISNLHYTRSIQFETVPSLPPLVGPDGIPLASGITENVRQVRVEVSWDQAGSPTSVLGSTLLTNWQPEE